MILRWEVVTANRPATNKPTNRYSITEDNGNRGTDCITGNILGAADAAIQSIKTEIGETNKGMRGMMAKLDETLGRHDQRMTETDKNTDRTHKDLGILIGKLEGNWVQWER